MPEDLDRQLQPIAERMRHALASGEPVPPTGDGEAAALMVGDAYRVQHAVIGSRRAHGERLCGYKVAMRTPPLHGEILHRDVVRDGGQVSVGAMVVPKIEAELAFVIGEPLAGDDLMITDVLAATAFVLPAFEVVDSRLVGGTKNPVPDLIADNSMFAAMVLGGPPHRVDAVDIRRIEVALRVGDEVAEVGATNRGSANPAHAVVELAAHLHGFGRGLHPGDVVLSGSCTTPVPVSAGDVVTGEFAGFGDVTVTFVP